MRIISGKSKGKKIFDPIDINTRPLKDLTKESIFNIITHSNKFNTALEKSNIFLPLDFPDIILIHLLLCKQYLFCKNHHSNLMI